jgi:hypothetical protein
MTSPICKNCLSEYVTQVDCIELPSPPNDDNVTELFFSDNCGYKFSIRRKKMVIPKKEVREEEEEDTLYYTSLECSVFTVINELVTW